MSETNEKKVTEQEGEKKTTAKKKMEKTEKKEGVLKRFGAWCGRHKEALITGAVSFVGGVGATVGTGIYLNKRNERKQRQQNACYIPEPNDDISPLDPNV